MNSDTQARDPGAAPPSPGGAGTPPAGVGSGDRSPWEHRARAWLDRPLLQLGTAFAFFSVVAVVSATQLFLNWSYAGVEAAYLGLLGVRLLEWWLWAVLVPVVVSLRRRLSEAGVGPAPSVGIHMALATVWFALVNVVPVALTPAIDPAAANAEFGPAYLNRALLRLTSAWVIYGAVLGATWVLSDFVKRQALARDLAEARHAALRAQVQPHFLFNTLNLVASLMRTGDRGRAIGTLVSLSELLRRSLAHVSRSRVPLAEELDFLDSYLEIQHTRFGEHLRVHSDIDPAALDVGVPPFLLQPLVENAIRHGLDLDRRPGEIIVRARVDGETVRIEVVDNGGRMVAPTEDTSEGIGLRTIRGRLQELYGRSQSLSIRSEPGRETVVTITLSLGENDRG